MRPDVEVCLCDTTGRADPAHVESLFAACMERFPEAGAWAFHAHDTYGLGLANVHAAYRQACACSTPLLAAWAASSLAPGATGNVATEDVVWMLERMGVPTGVDLDALIPVARDGASLPGGMPAACATRSRRSQRPVQPNPCRSCHERRHKALRMSDHAYSHTQSRGRLYDGSITRRSCGLDGADEQFGFRTGRPRASRGYPSKVVTMVVPAAPGAPRTLPRG